MTAPIKERTPSKRKPKAQSAELFRPLDDCRLGFQPVISISGIGTAKSTALRESEWHKLSSSIQKTRTFPDI